MRPRDDPRPVRLHGLLLFAVVAAGYAVGYELAKHWFSAPSQGASFFPPAGLTLAALLAEDRGASPAPNLSSEPAPG